MLIEERTVLKTLEARFEAVLNRLNIMGVAGHICISSASFLHRGLQLGHRELCILEPVVQRDDAAGYTDLQLRCSATKRLSSCGADSLNTVTNLAHLR